MEMIRKHVKSFFAVLLSMVVVCNGVAGHVTVTKAQDTKQYKEMKFGDWGKSEGSYTFSSHKLSLYSLTDPQKLTSLDGVAISGKINFNGITGRAITMGGTSKLKYGGFWLRSQEKNCWNLSAQGIGTGAAVNIWDVKALMNGEAELRITFDKETGKDNWEVNVSVDGTLIQTQKFTGVTPGLYLGIPEGVTVDMTPSAENKTYTEWKLSAWQVSLGKMYNMNVYRLQDSDSAKITSLDGMAVTGKVNYKGVTKALFRIGGNDTIKYGGFAFVDDGGALKVVPQGIGGDTNPQVVVDKTKWQDLKNREFTLKVTFDKNKKTEEWELGVYVNDTYCNTYNCGKATPGLFLACDDNVELEKAPVTPTEKEYLEKTFDDWGTTIGKFYGLNVYGMTKNEISSLNGVAVSGTVNYNGIEKAMLRIGGNEEMKFAGFALLDNRGTLTLVAQGIGGDTTPYVVVDSAEWQKLKTQEFRFRVTFDKNDATGVWNVGVFINDTNRGTYNCGTANPGLYVAYDDNITLKLQEVQSPDTNVYKELKFADWGIYCGVVSGMDIYRLKGHDDITSLHGIAISGTVNFNGVVRKYIAIGGTEQLKNGGFWLGAVQEKWWLVAAQGIGGTNKPGDMLSAAAKFKDDVELRITFWQDSAEQWTIGVYADGVYVGSYTFEGVAPELYLGVNPLLAVEGLGDTVKNAGLDFSLFGYKNETWRKEMGLE